MLRSVKLAEPAEALLVVVPLKTPPPGLAPIEIVIDAVDEVTVFPTLSCRSAVGGPEITVPAMASPGCVEKATLLGGPGITLNEVLSQS
jgi:hypothetical protein